MTDVKTFKYRTNLARKMAVTGGCSITEALARSDSALEQHRAPAMKALADRVNLLGALSAARAPDTERDVYEQSAALLDLAGFFDTGPFCSACFSLCELSVMLTETNRWNWSSIDVHVQALRLILASDCKETEQTALILDGLANILLRFSTPNH